jgi:nucleotide-binding universal stress UspA family protein
MGLLLASLQRMTVVALIRRLRDEYTAMPGLCLTEAQVQRLCDVSVATSASALRALVSAGFLRPLEGGSYRRADLAPDDEQQPSPGAREAPWRRILCLIEFEDDRRESLTAASYSALGYAITLGVTHRARVTALHLVPGLPETIRERQQALERVTEDVRRHARGSAMSGLIDVHVAEGSSNEDLLSAACEMRADLIVLGRRDSGAASLSQLREMLRDAPCHVLIVHPSGQAAVA